MHQTISRSGPTVRTTRRFVIMGLLCALAAMALLAGCSSDESSSVATPVKADVDTYLADLNAWPAPAADSEGATGGSSDETDSVGGQEYSCTTTPYSITTTPEKIVVFNPDADVFWLGALLQGDGFRGGLGSLEELPVRQRAPMEISIDLLGTSTSRVVESPSLASVTSAVGDLVTEAENSGQTFASDILFTQTETYSVQQSALKMGLSASYLGGDISASLDYSQDASQHTVSAYFLQSMFTTSVAPPQLPGDVFSSAFTADRLQEQVDQGNIGPDNQPAYISSITWGRLMLLTITSSASVTEIRAALTASYSAAAGSGSGSVDAASLAILNEASIQLVTLGGDQAAALGYLRTGQLSEFFAEDAPLTSAVPLSFTVKDLRSGNKALVSETTSYNVKTCSPVAPDPIGAQYRVRLDLFEIVNGNCDGGGYFEAYWNVSANAPVATSRSESNPYDAYHATTVAINSVWSSWVDVKFDGTGAITINGTMYDDDSFGDDVIAAWDITRNTSNISAGTFDVSGGSPDGESCRVDLRFTIQKGADIFAP